VLFRSGIREPFITRWPGKIRPRTTSDLPSAAYDLLPTLCDVAGAKLPARTDGISLLPTLLGKGRQTQHEFLYWEFPAYGGQQAIRVGDWKGIRQNLRKGQTQLELYNLATDIGETTNVAIAHPAIVDRLTRLMQSNHEPSALFPLPAIDAKRPAE
jgi:arylsulfatase A